MTQTIKIRWVDDEEELAAVVQLEQECFGEDAWDLRRLGEFLENQTTNQFKVLIDGREVVGYMLYTIGKQAIFLRRIAVLPNRRRQKLGERMLAYMVKTLKHMKRDAILADVSEYNLDAQLFFRACGFRCEHILPGPSGATYRMARDF